MGRFKAGGGGRAMGTWPPFFLVYLKSNHLSNGIILVVWAPLTMTVVKKS